MTVIRSPISPVIFSPFRAPTTLYKGGGFDPLSLFDNPAGTMVGLERGRSGSVWVWSQIKDSLFIRARLDLDAEPGSRFSWRETRLCDLRKVYPVGVLTLSGSWTQINTSGSGATTAKHIGDRMAQTTTNGNYAEVEVTRAGGKPYDLWIAYTGGTAGAYCRVDIDGAQTLVNEISDPAALGYKAFSTEAPVNSTRRLLRKVASGLTGTHTIRATKSAAAAGNTFAIEAIVISGDIEDDRILPPLWQPSTAYTIGDEVQLNGIYYCARATATSDAGSGPTHSSGIASDGTMDWNANLFPSYHEQIVIDYLSEREYAFNITITATDDLGGQTHGNETLVSRTLEIDGDAWSESGAFGVITVGEEIVGVETITWTHTNDASLADCTLSRVYVPGKFRHNVVVEFTTATVGLGFSYPGMMPLVSWDGLSAERVFTSLKLDTGQTLNLDDYSGEANPTVNYGNVYSAAALGNVDGHSLGYGVRVTPESVDNYSVENANFFVLPNIGGQTASGSTDWSAKAYFERSSDPQEAFTNGQTLVFENEHAFKLL